MPSRENESVLELFGWPTPDEIESSSDAKRVCGDVTSRSSGRTETLFL
jgi:hypothetical protein